MYVCMYVSVGLDSGAQCLPNHHVEYGDSETVRTPQLPQKVRARHRENLCGVHRRVIVSFVVN